MQHEAHRDGVVTSDNALETRRAVAAHTAMAMKVARDYGLGVILGNQNLVRDVAAYHGGARSFFQVYSGSLRLKRRLWKQQTVGN
ncbi:hypothetical protein ES705_43418 [subsurface metagenome]